LSVYVVLLLYVSQRPVLFPVEPPLWTSLAHTEKRYCPVARLVVFQLNVELVE
jgi:hypothetical protein